MFEKDLRKETLLIILINVISPDAKALWVVKKPTLKYLYLGPKYGSGSSFNMYNIVFY